MTDAEIGKAYRALTRDEADALHAAIDRILRGRVFMNDPVTCLVNAYLEGRKSLLDEPAMYHELYGGKSIENKIVVRRCQRCGVDTPPGKA